MNESDNMTVTGDDRPEHRMLTDDVIDLCDFSSTSMLEDAVRPKRDMDAEDLVWQAEDDGWKTREETVNEWYDIEYQGAKAKAPSCSDSTLQRPYLSKGRRRPEKKTIGS